MNEWKHGGLEEIQPPLFTCVLFIWLLLVTDSRVLYVTCSVSRGMSTESSEVSRKYDVTHGCLLS